ncbi:MAG: hypothetical protein P8075_01570 [Deltaproteobacteria bacterium]
MYVACSPSRLHWQLKISAKDPGAISAKEPGLVILIHGVDRLVKGYEVCLATVWLNGQK